MEKQQKMKRRAKAHAQAHGMKYQAALQQLRKTDPVKETPAQTYRQMLASQREHSVVLKTLPHHVWIMASNRRVHAGEGPYIRVEHASKKELEHHCKFFAYIECDRGVEETLAALRPDLSDEERKQLLSWIPSVEERNDDIELDPRIQTIDRNDNILRFPSVAEWLDACVTAETDSLEACGSPAMRLLGFKTSSGEVLAVHVTTLRFDVDENPELQNLKKFIRNPVTRQELGILLLRERQWREKISKWALEQERPDAVDPRIRLERLINQILQGGDLTGDEFRSRVMEAALNERMVKASRPT